MVEAWRTVRDELEAYGEDLGDKTEILVLYKVDALDAETRARPRPRRWPRRRATSRALVSGVSGEGVTELLRAAYALVRAAQGRGGRRRPEASGEAPEDWTP